MCLVISDCHSKKRSGKYKAKISFYPIKVYKVLWTYSSSERWRTPCMNTVVPFKNGIAIMYAYDMIRKYRKSKTKTRINTGIHSFLSKESAEAMSSEMLTYIHGYSIDIFEAYIPPFTRYFIGNKGDIVSEMLIVKK